MYIEAAKEKYVEEYKHLFHYVTSIQGNLKPKTKLNCIKIHKYMGWCNDPKSKKYNNRVNINYNFTHEKLFRKDHKYDYLIVIEYNYKKIKKNKGSAIFLHLTKDYKKTEGCVVVSKKDFLILSKLINKNTKIFLN